MSFRMSQKGYSYSNNVIKMQCYRISLSKLDSGVAQLSVREPEVAIVSYSKCTIIVVNLFYFIF